MRIVGVVIGILALIAGIIFTLQGVNILGGSSMSGQTMWAIIGPIVVIVGLVLLAVSLLGGRRAAAS
ncbi:MAG: hypothetical protein ACLQUY_16740 [Ktedonobacterales bacterium]